MRNALIPLLKNISLSTLLLSNVTYAAERCITIEWYASPDSNVTAAAVPNQSFVSLNGQAIVFNVISSTINKISSGKIIQSHSLGCFDVNALRVGANTFHFSFVYSGKTKVITGTTSADVILAKGEANSKVLCQARQGGGQSNGYSCDSTIVLDLAEVDPKAAQQIEAIKRQEKTLSEELARLKNLDRLREQFEALLKIDLETLSGDQLENFSVELKSIANAIEGYKKTVEEQRALFRAELAKEKESLSRYKSAAVSALNSEGINVSSSKTYQKYDLGPLSLTTIDIPLMTEAAEADQFDLKNNVYLDLTGITLGRLREAVGRDDRVEVAMIIESWSETFRVLSQALENRLGITSIAEQNTLLTSMKSVREYLAPIVDEQGFFKDTGVPEDVKQSIREGIEPHDPEKAHLLRDVLNQWKKDQPAHEKKIVLNVIRGLSIAFKGLVKGSEDYQEGLRSMDRILVQTIEVAKVAGRVGLVATPLNDYVDFCEVITGRELCLPSGSQLSVSERAISTLGLVIGTGAFWRKFGATYLEGREIRTVCDEAQRLTSSLTTAEKQIVQQALSKNIRVSRHGREYLIKLMKSGQRKTTQDVERILARYSDLEKKMKNVRGIHLKEIVTRGVKRRPEMGSAVEISDVFKPTKYSKEANHRFSIGGELGDNAIYGALGPKDKAVTTVFAELRETADDVFIATKEFELNNVLDLTNNETVRLLDLNKMKDLLKTFEKNGFEAYEVSQQIGNIAKQLGFDGIKTFSAQTDTIAGITLVIFK